MDYGDLMLSIEILLRSNWSEGLSVWGEKDKVLKNFVGVLLFLLMMECQS